MPKQETSSAATDPAGSCGARMSVREGVLLAVAALLAGIVLRDASAVLPVTFSQHALTPSPSLLPPPPAGACLAALEAANAPSVAAAAALAAAGAAKEEAAALFAAAERSWAAANVTREESLASSTVAGVGRGAALPIADFSARSIPFGQVWSRWDVPHGARHMTWLITGARLIVGKRQLVVKSNADRPLNLAVRTGSTSAFLAEMSEPPPCTHVLATGLISTSVSSVDWNNFWHFNADDFFLLLHALVNEHAAGAAGVHAPPSLFMSPPFSVRDSADYSHIPPFEVANNLSRFINDEVRTFFGQTPFSDAPNAVFWLRGGGPEDTKLSRGGGTEDARVVCFDRVYLGSDTQCAVIGVMDAADANRDECQGVYRMFRAAVAKMLGGEEGSTMLRPVSRQERPRVYFVDRTPENSHAKRITNLSEALVELRAVLTERFGAGEFDFEVVFCADFASTARWWSRATLVIMTRGACQANMPLLRDEGGLLWIGPCGDDNPQLNPQPKYFATEVYHPPVIAPNCNFADLTVSAKGLGAALSNLLARVHPRV